MTEEVLSQAFGEEISLFPTLSVTKVPLGLYEPKFLTEMQSTAILLTQPKVKVPTAPAITTNIKALSLPGQKARSRATLTDLSSSAVAPFLKAELSLSTQIIQVQRQTQSVAQLQRSLQRMHEQYQVPDFLNPFKPSRKPRGKKAQRIGQYKRWYPVLTGLEAFKLEKKLF